MNILKELKILSLTIKILILEKVKLIIYDEIEDYTFTKKNYDKVFPKQQSIKDFEIFRQCIKLSWITIDLLSEKKYVLDNLITSINKYFAKTNRK